MKKFKVNDAEKIEREQAGFVRVEDILGEPILIGNVDSYTTDSGADAIEFDVRLLEKDNRIERIRTQAKIIVRQLKRQRKFSVKTKFNKKSTSRGRVYYDFV